MADIENIFTDTGGEFIIAANMIGFKLNHVNTFLFDWDGVFNSGTKGENINSNYTEVDSMGLNMLRFGYWLKNGKLPLLGIITGQNNLSAIHLAEREHFNFVYLGFINKSDALGHLKDTHQISDEQVAFAFDDVLDIAIASKCGLRLAVKNNASPLFTNYLKQNNLADYITANAGANHAVREICELILGISETFNDAIRERAAFSDVYRKYLAERNGAQTKYYKFHHGSVVQQDVI